MVKKLAVGRRANQDSGRGAMCGGGTLLAGAAIPLRLSRPAPIPPKIGIAGIPGFAPAKAYRLRLK